MATVFRRRLGFLFPFFFLLVFFFFRFLFVLLGLEVFLRRLFALPTLACACGTGAGPQAREALILFMHPKEEDISKSQVKLMPVTMAPMNPLFSIHSSQDLAP